MDINRYGIIPVVIVVIVVVGAVVVVVVVSLCGITLVCRTVVVGTVVGDNNKCGVIPKVTVVVVGEDVVVRYNKKISVIHKFTFLLYREYICVG